MPRDATALQDGNRALRSGRADQAIRHYALALAEANQPPAPGSNTQPTAPGSSTQPTAPGSSTQLAAPGSSTQPAAPGSTPSTAPGPIGHQLAQNLLLARKRYRRQRQASINVSGKLQVVVTCWSLSENPAGRAYTLASLYQDLVDHPDPPEDLQENGVRPPFKGTDPQDQPSQAQPAAPGIERVSLIGSRFARRGDQLWAPLRELAEHGPIPIHSILIEDERAFMAQAIDLVSAHPADLVHLVKPRWPNILFGLLYQLLWDARVLVDIDDDELAFVQGEPLPDLATHSAEQVLEAEQARGRLALRLLDDQPFAAIPELKRVVMLTLRATLEPDGQIKLFFAPAPCASSRTGERSDHVSR